MKRRAVVGTLILGTVLVVPIHKAVDVEVKVSPIVKARTKATMAEKTANKIMAMRYAKAGWNWDRTQRRCAYALFMAESKFDHLAKNQRGSSAYGIGQVLKEKSSDPAIQILNAYKYIEHRYDTPCRAWTHHQRRNWY
jgi:hypothetical protein